MLNNNQITFFRSKYLFVFLLLSLFFLSACQRVEQSNEDKVAALNSEVELYSNIEYAKREGESLYLDAYLQGDKIGRPPWVNFNKKRPVLLYFHGGGWSSGDKISRSLLVMPYVLKGWHVVNVDYRLISEEVPLQKIIGDCRLALKWVFDNAEKYNFDTSKIVLSGESAGGHLAMMTALVKDDRPYFDSTPTTYKNMPVAAIVNWFGPADIKMHMARFNNSRANKLMGGNDKFTHTSPIEHFDQQSPPIITIFGDKDPLVGYEDQAVSLHKKLDSLGLRNKLVTIYDGEHGNFVPQAQAKAFNEIWRFLDKLNLKVSRD